MRNVAEMCVVELDFNQCIDYFVDTFPRSGTHYLLGVLDEFAEVDYSGTGSGVRESAQARPQYLGVVQLGGVYFCIPSAAMRYVVKSHFFMNRPAPELFAPDAMAIRQFSFFLDGIYSWAHLLARKSAVKAVPAKYDGFRVESASSAWRIIRGHFPMLLRWLRGIDRREVIRYEDYEQPRSSAVRRLVARLGRPARELFASFSPDSRRLYYVPPDRFKAVADTRFEPAVYAEVVDVLGVYFREFYPEIAL